MRELAALEALLALHDELPPPCSGMSVSSSPAPNKPWVYWRMLRAASSPGSEAKRGMVGAGIEGVRSAGSE